MQPEKPSRTRFSAVAPTPSVTQAHTLSTLNLAVRMAYGGLLQRGSAEEELACYSQSSSAQSLTTPQWRI